MFARVALAVLVAATAWSALARPSGAHGDRAVYRVRPYDTLWTIAAARYGGDVRDGVWRIERTNHLRDPTLHPGQRLVLP